MKTNLQPLLFGMKKLLPGLLLLLVNNVGFGQATTHRDSLMSKVETFADDSIKVNLLYELASAYIKDDMDKSLQLCKQGEEISRKIDYRKGVLNYYTKYSTILNFRGDFNAALKTNLEAMDYAGKYSDSTELARTMLNVGLGYRQLEDYETAVIYIEKAKDLMIKRNVHRYDANIFNLLQLLYHNMHQYRRGVTNGLNAIRAVGKDGDQEVLRQSYNNLGRNYLSLKMYDSARYYLKLAAIEARKNEDVVVQTVTSLNFALIALKQKKFDSVRRYVNDALVLSKKYGGREYEGLAKYGIAYDYLLKKEYGLSSLYADSALHLANEYNMQDLKQKVYALLSSLNYGRQDTHAGYDYFDQYEMLSDSLLNTSITNSTIRIEKKMELERKDAKIKLQEIQLEQKNLLNYFLGAGAVALLLILLLSYRNYSARQKLQQAKIDELEIEKQLTATAAVLKGEEQERTRLAKDLHDGLGGMLSGIKFSLNRVKENLVMTPDNADAFERSIDMLDSSIQEMRRVAHNMMPEMLLKYGLNTALKEFCMEIDRRDVTRVQYQSAGVNNTIQQTLTVTVYRIVQELVSNAIKHSGARNVLVQVHQLSEEKLLAITVEDDGNGFDTRLLNESAGMGWRNIQSRVEFLNGRLDIQSSGKGTSVMIEIDIV